MPSSYFPTRDGLLVTWGNTFASVLTATPTLYGATAPIATAITAKATAFADAYATAMEPTTRTRATIAAKNTAKQAFKEAVRPVVRVIYGQTALTDEQIIAIGLRPHDGSATPINPPEEQPVVEVVSVIGRTVEVRLHSLDTEKRGKPEGVAGASVFSFLGDAPPADVNLWKFEASTTRTIFQMDFPAATAAGSQFWITAFWFNPRQQSGPMANPVSDFLGGGVAEAA